jgi:hypothetical protein
VTTWDYDPSHGADADGNRGVPRTEIDEDYAQNIVVEFPEEDHNPGKHPLYELSDALQALIMAELDSYLHSVEPTPEDPYGDDDGPDEDWRKER